LLDNPKTIERLRLLSQPHLFDVYLYKKEMLFGKKFAIIKL